MKNRQQLTDEITDKCEQAGCSEKISKIHLDQYVNRNWDPHPPDLFVRWWRKQKDYSEGIDAKRAWNCQCYRQQFLEAKDVGIAA